MLNHLLNAAAGLGNLLDTPGSMVRDTLAGQNPFDQLANPFSSANRFSGRDLLRHYGLAGHEDTWGNFAGGLATELATDPLNLVGGGLIKRALGRQGEIAGAHRAIAALDPLHPGFSDDIIHALTGRRVSPLTLESQQAWQKSLSPEQLSAVGEWTRHSTGPNALERGIEDMHSGHVFDAGGSYFNYPVGERLTESQFRDMLPRDQAMRYQLPKSPPYSRENVERYINAPLREAIATSSLPHDTEVFRAHVLPASVGDIVHDPGFMATSVHRQPSNQHMNIFYDRDPSPDREIANIVAPAGSHGGLLHGLAGGFSHGEAEMLFHKPHLRVLAKRELPVVTAEGGVLDGWRRGTGVGNYVPDHRSVGSRVEDVLSGETPGSLKHGVQSNYLMEIVPKNYRSPLTERLSIPLAGLGLGAHNIIARPRLGRPQ